MGVVIRFEVICVEYGVSECGVVGLVNNEEDDVVYGIWYIGSGDKWIKW